MQENTTLTVDKSKYTVVTSYWGKGGAFNKYINSFTKATQSYGGKEVITLTNGYSPSGYVYNPDYFTITEWESKTAFDTFYKNYKALSETNIDNVHQFVLKLGNL